MTDALRRADFEALAGAVCRAAGDERITLYLEAETSDFLRFNRAAVRQATQVAQAHATLTVSRDGRMAQARLALCGRIELDLALLARERAALLALLTELPVDPYLLLPDEIASSERDERGVLPEAADVIEAVSTHAAGLDFVGFYAGGPVVRAFADSRGQRNWHRVESFHFEWCLYQERDKAVKTTYADTRWSEGELVARLDAGRARLPLLALPARRLDPGAYRAYLAPAAMGELLDTLAWGGFGLKDRMSGTSSLMRLAQGAAVLDARVQLAEATARGIAPAFTAEGFRKPGHVLLIDAGRNAGTLNSPRSAREFSLEANGAGAAESPESLCMAAGNLPEAGALAALDRGLAIANLWYLNYSDRQACRMTGMTRFACFWVEGGKPVAPLDVMRFDDSFLRLFGEGLVALTSAAHALPNGETYQCRQLRSTSAPGAIVEGLTLAL